MDSIPATLMQELQDFADRLADAAGDTIRPHFRQPIGVQKKDDLSPVTRADRETEANIRMLIEQTYPDHGIIGEEYGSKQTDSPFMWVIDPIDGTRAFVAGKPTFVTLISLLYQGTSILGVIDQPILRERWIGVKGMGTRFNGGVAYPSKLSNIADVIIAATSPSMFKGEQWDKADALIKSCSSVSWGGDGYNYGLLTSGYMQLVIEASMQIYDFLPLVSVVEQAGGVITDWHGKPLDENSDGTVLAAANTALHTAALKKLSG